MADSEDGQQVQVTSPPRGHRLAARPQHSTSGVTLGEISFELCLFRAHALRSTPQQQALCEGRPEQPRMT